MSSPPGDHAALEAHHKRLAEEQRQREEAERLQRDEAALREREQGYRVLQETHERAQETQEQARRDEQTAQQFAAQAREITDVNYSQAAAAPMEVERSWAVSERVDEGERIQTRGDMQLTPEGVMSTFRHHEPARERPQAEGSQEITDRRAETRDRDSERARIHEAMERSISRQKEERERDRDDGREL